MAGFLQTVVSVLISQQQCSVKSLKSDVHLLTNATAVVPYDFDVLDIY